MKKVLITGAKGQLGSELVPILSSRGYLVYPFGSRELDITNQSLVNESVKDVNPSVIIHCAAYTNVDQAESTIQRAFEVNAVGSRNVAVAARNVNSKLVYLSTNYVFDGMKRTAYTEYDTPNPINVYGSSKLAGEQYVKEFSPNHFILRTSWLYGGDHKNFVTMMQDLAKKKDSLSIVTDQIGNPTYTYDLANKMIEIFETEKYGTYHVSNSGQCSWFEFAKEIFHVSNIAIELSPVTTEEYAAPAPRPKNSTMEPFNLTLNNFLVMRRWEEALREYVKEIEKRALWKVN
ncbi:dTDP-4-dehydrorhamnose reductase [Alkalihalobacillus sp. CinArs1]|uniref:dTDP-4-dehydrorhamnose reductase n=1 Tax=Alkalihalobacillus sp. CinArs1 TaxID=2995314 RepID=UPI0022DE274D|nr:dTDP-4-dehydrorhamnose reductase [Alkalihalobacillus sp. CinArs1]